ncbi:hypothetical protein GN958_ATG07603, partial [Phytophthora infestans]
RSSMPKRKDLMISVATPSFSVPTAHERASLGFWTRRYNRGTFYKGKPVDWNTSVASATRLTLMGCILRKPGLTGRSTRKMCVLLSVDNCDHGFNRRLDALRDLVDASGCWIISIVSAINYNF